MRTLQGATSPGTYTPIDTSNLPSRGPLVGPAAPTWHVGDRLYFTAEWPVSWSLVENSGATIEPTGGTFVATVAGTYHVVATGRGPSTTTVVTVLA